MLSDKSLQPFYTRPQTPISILQTIVFVIEVFNRFRAFYDISSDISDILKKYKWKYRIMDS